jgi:hypothetical protein
MSKEDILAIVEKFDNGQYVEYMLNRFHSSEWKESWSKNKILKKLEDAFSHGFVGIHFIPCEYEGCIEKILHQYFGIDHYISYRICEKHSFIILEPHFRKLQVSPSKYISKSYKRNPTLHALQEDGEYVSFCYE